MAQAKISDPLSPGSQNGIRDGKFPTAGNEKPLHRVKGMALPAGLLSLFIFTQLFDYHALGLVTITPDKLLFVGIAGYFAYASATGQLRSIPWSRTEICMGLFAGLCLVSYIVTNPDGDGERMKWLTTLFNLLAYPFVLYAFARRTRYTRSKLLAFLKAVVCIGVYLALTAIFEHFRIDALVFPKYIVDPNVGIQFGRARGPMVGSNPMGEWLVVVYFATCLLVPFSRMFVKVLLQILLLLVTIGIYFTLTRGAWISFAIMVLLLGTLGSTKARVQSRLIILAVIIAFFAGVGSKFSFGGETLFSRRQNTIDYRLSNNKTTFAMGMDHPLFGVGYGNFGKTWKLYFGSEEKELTNDLTDGNHNTYLGFFADMGVPGVSLYVILMLSVLMACFHVRQSLDPKDQLERNFALGSAGVVLILLWEAMSGDMRFNPTLNVLTFLFSGIAASMFAWRSSAVSVAGAKAGLPRGAK